MDIEKLALLKSKFVSRVIGNELILVPLTENIARMNEMFTLNETAKLIWENIDKVRNSDELVSLIIDEFEVDKSIATSDVDRFIAGLEEMEERKTR